MLHVNREKIITIPCIKTFCSDHSYIVPVASALHLGSNSAGLFWLTNFNKMLLLWLNYNGYTYRLAHCFVASDEYYKMLYNILFSVNSFCSVLQIMTFLEKILVPLGYLTVWLSIGERFFKMCTYKQRNLSSL